MAFPASNQAPGYDTVQGLIRVLDLAIEGAYAYRSKIQMHDPVLWIPGMSTARVRYFLNNLCSFGAVQYLEIGTWAGSTLCSALFKNHRARAVAIDNFCEFNDNIDPKRELFKHLEAFSPQLGEHRVIEADCLVLEPDEVGSGFNIFFFDGNHDLEPTALGIRRYMQVMHNPCILVVDDWQLKEEVREGVFSALARVAPPLLPPPAQKR